jgi:hypothetical protein
MSNSITTKRFVMRKSLIGTNTIITFTNKKDVTYTTSTLFIMPIYLQLILIICSIPLFIMLEEKIHNRRR